MKQCLKSVVTGSNVAAFVLNLFCERTDLRVLKGFGVKVFVKVNDGFGRNGVLGFEDKFRVLGRVGD